MAYREGPSALDVATELHEEARALQIQAELAWQNGEADVQLAKLDVQRSRRELGFLIEIERQKHAYLRASGQDPPEGDSEEVARARAAVTSGEAKLALTEEQLKQAYDQKADAARRYDETKAELDRLR